MFSLGYKNAGRKALGATNQNISSANNESIITDVCVILPYAWECVSGSVSASVAPCLRSSWSFPLSNSRLRLRPPCPSACSRVPEFPRVLNFREMTSLDVCLSPGLNLYLRLLLLPRPKPTTSEAEKQNRDRWIRMINYDNKQLNNGHSLPVQVKICVLMYYFSTVVFRLFQSITHDDGTELLLISCNTVRVWDWALKVQGPWIMSTKTHIHIHAWYYSCSRAYVRQRGLNLFITFH